MKNKVTSSSIEGNRVAAGSEVEPMYMEFAEFILNMRTAAGMSINDLAHHMCMSITTLQACERGEKIPRNPAKFEYHLREIVKTEIRKRRFYHRDLRYTAV